MKGLNTHAHAHAHAHTHKCTTLVSDADNRGGYQKACWEAGGIWGISVPSSQFYYKPKTALKKKVF